MSESHLTPSLRHPLSPVSLVLSWSLALSLPPRSSSCSHPRLFTLPRPPTPDVATTRSSVGRLARSLRRGLAGVAWTEINIRRASTYSIPLPCSPRSRPLCPLSPSRPLSLSSSNPPTAPLPPSLTSSTPTFLILSTAPCSLEGGLAHIHARMHTHAHTRINTRLYVYGERQRASKPSISVQGVFRYATGDPRVPTRVVLWSKDVFLMMNEYTFNWSCANLQVIMAIHLQCCYT